MLMVQERKSVERICADCRLTDTDTAVVCALWAHFHKCYCDNATTTTTTYHLAVRSLQARHALSI